MVVWLFYTSVLLYSPLDLCCLHVIEVLACSNSTALHSAVRPCSVVDCGDPGNPQNGRRILQGGTKYQNNVTYECDTGFSLEGVAFRTCSALAVWSGSQPSCTRK